MQEAKDVLDFWFVESSPQDWFGGKKEFDIQIKSGFAHTHYAVSRGEAWTWRETAQGRLAEIIVLDQFTRQLFRDKAEAFACDAMALTLAQEMVASGKDMDLTPQQRGFAYMPYMHSESAKVHEQAVKIFTNLKNENMLKYELEHQQLIGKFGRYPKRNEALNRTSTAAELEYIAGSGDSFF